MTTRQHLPNRRPAWVETIAFGGFSYEVGFGIVDAEVREVFITIPEKEGTPAAIGCADAGVLISLLLQYGAGAREISHSLLRAGGGPTTAATAPASIIGHVVDRIEEINREIGHDGQE